ncbi:hypothetical protein GBA65_07490 [Rubrobacter marinus]|uniref:Cation-transporting P-type ATPase N-terminal domain-containing protein n=1 Tax=Rubrobacter marinus TaxID=2653852 RepID=A0A6G8Q309_9ACTN|nr:hypothetical protein GBA65_07490 [Rubrobacter marinus]
MTGTPSRPQRFSTFCRQLSGRPDGGRGQKRLEASGPNTLGRARGDGVLRILLRRVNDSLIYVLLGAVERAFGLVRESYPGADAELVLPVEPETFFVGDDFDGAEMIVVQTPSSAAWRGYGCEHPAPVEVSPSARKKGHAIEKTWSPRPYRARLASAGVGRQRQAKAGCAKNRARPRGQRSTRYADGSSPSRSS